jgi:hypothetical protein
VANKLAKISLGSADARGAEVEQGDDELQADVSRLSLGVLRSLAMDEKLARASLVFKRIMRGSDGCCPRKPAAPGGSIKPYEGRRSEYEISHEGIAWGTFTTSRRVCGSSSRRRMR